MSEQDIDLNKLSQRELLILVYNKVETLEKTSYQQTKKQQATDIEIAVIKTKFHIWGAIIGFCTGIAGSIIVFVITKAME